MKQCFSSVRGFIIPFLVSLGLLISSCRSESIQQFNPFLDGKILSVEVPYEPKYLTIYDEQTELFPRSVQISPNDPDKIGVYRKFYELFLERGDDKIVIHYLFERLKPFNLSEESVVLALVDLVQRDIAYDHEKINAASWDVSYPFETLIQKKGVCSDKSLLLGKILFELNYDFCFYIFEEANHMALGIRVPEGQGTFPEAPDYAFIETTTLSPIGFVVNDPDGDELLNPIIIYPSLRGEKKFEFYDEYIHRIQEEKNRSNGITIQHLSDSKRTIYLDLITFEMKLDSMNLIALETQDQIDEYNGYVESYNLLVNEFNEAD